MLPLHFHHGELKMSYYEDVVGAEKLHIWTFDTRLNQLVTRKVIELEEPDVSFLKVICQNGFKLFCL
jgi:hypothetical protein